VEYSIGNGKMLLNQLEIMDNTGKVPQALILLKNMLEYAIGHTAPRKDIAGVIRSCFRGDDVIARIGGDEFAALLPGADEQATDKIVQRILSKTDDYASKHLEMLVGISIGVHTIQRGESLNDALKVADSRMYQVKNLKKIHKVSEDAKV
jgi:diguanylate cyclase (GGDEF)-like protein